MRLRERTQYRGILQYLKALTYHTEDSLCVQSCRILSELTSQKNSLGDYVRKVVREEWREILLHWSQCGDTKLHFFADKVLYNAREKNNREHYLDEPIFLLYDSGEKDVAAFHSDHSQRIADVVFIHGLQGSFFSTWMVQQPNSDYHHVVCWPATYLPAYLHAHGADYPVRILSVGYHARMRKASSPHPTLSVAEQASELRNQLESAGIGERPVVFVTHSMGGLIVKEMLVEDSKWALAVAVT